MNIGTLTLPDGAALLAPMAGVADRAFRELCVAYGAAYTVSEMVSCKGITMHDRKSNELLELSEKERPAAIQLFGDSPEIMARAAVMSLGYRPQAIDINMGCPAPKISGNGAGSALMKNPQLAEKIVRAVVDAAELPVSVKLRTGWDSENKNAVEIALRAQQAGAAFITVHGRTRQQMYAAPVDYEAIAAVKKAVEIPVIGNGDVTDGKSAALMLERTGCDAVMVGRGALGKPWVFAQICAYLRHGTVLEPPPLNERMQVMLSHIEKVCEYKGMRIGMREARKHAAWYIRDIRGAAKYRRSVCTLETLEQLRELASLIVAENPGIEETEIERSRTLTASAFNQIL